jgi:hypothetical protein
MALKSKWFADNIRCQQCAVDHGKHILRGDSGLHVYLVQQALNMLDGSVIEGKELDQWSYGPSTAAAVLRYKEARDIVNRSYQQKADDIVGKMTMASLDEGMSGFESGIMLLGGAGMLLGRILLAAPKVVKTGGPKMVVITETAQPWSKWADQFVAAKKAGRAKVPIPNGHRPAAIAEAYKRAIGLAGPGGTVIISVGHGIPSDASKDEGMFDLGPKGSFKIGGRNALLVGDPPPNNWPKDKKLVFHHTQVFYADSPPKPYQSRKADDEASGSAAARQRLANWKAYEDIANAFKAQKLAMVVMLTCRIGGSTGMIKRVAQQWGTPITGYTRRIVGQEVDGRARVFLEGDPAGTYYQWPNTTNTPASETFFPLSRDMVQVNP